MLLKDFVLFIIFVIEGFCVIYYIYVIEGFCVIIFMLLTDFVLFII